MSFFDLRYTGSFQSSKVVLYAEEPLREVWARIAQLGSVEFLRSNFKPTNGIADWDGILKYASVRIRQAVEFRNSAKSATTLTSALPLYYSLLNLLRACTALAFDEIPDARRHGLTFKEGGDLLSSAARVTQGGTFKEYLNRMNVSINENLSISFRDVVSRIIELRSDYCTIPNIGAPSLAIPVTIEATIGGPLCLRFPKFLQDFNTKWNIYFPQLTDCCSLTSEENVLEVTKGQFESDSDVGIFCAEKLEPCLIFGELNVWFAVQRMETFPLLPRPAHYFVALFILGSIVRYQPELLSEVINPDAHMSWFVQRVLDNAERFFPQLMISWLNNNDQIYF